MSKEPDVQVPMPEKYGAPYCPSCGYKCGCCCVCSCQSPCNDPIIEDDEEYCGCRYACHGGHEPWDCNDWGTRYRWAKAKSERMEQENE